MDSKKLNVIQSPTYTVASTPAVTASFFYAEIQIYLAQCTLRGLSVDWRGTLAEIELQYSPQSNRVYKISRSGPLATFVATDYQLNRMILRRLFWCDRT